MLSSYLIYMYLLLFADYCRLVHQLEEVSVCWMLRLMLQHQPALSRVSLYREDPGEDAFAAGHLHLSGLGGVEAPRLQEVKSLPLCLL